MLIWLPPRVFMNSSVTRLACLVASFAVCVPAIGSDIPFLGACKGEIEVEDSDSHGTRLVQYLDHPCAIPEKCKLSVPRSGFCTIKVGRSIIRIGSQTLLELNAKERKLLILSGRAVIQVTPGERFNISTRHYALGWNNGTVNVIADKSGERFETPTTSNASITELKTGKRIPLSNSQNKAVSSTNSEFKASKIEP